MSWMDTLKYYIYIYIIIHIGYTWKRDKVKIKRFINLYHDKIRIFSFLCYTLFEYPAKTV